MRFRSTAMSAVLGCAMSLVAFAQVDRVPSGTEITVRTNESIKAKSSEAGKIYTGVVDRDVLDSSGRVMIPRGSNAELAIREVSSNNVAVDLEAVNINGRRYEVDAVTESTSGDRKDGVGGNKRTAKYVGGGAAIGSIIGAIAGGGKGAAIGAATGAGAGAVGQTVTRGSRVNVPSESLLTFRLDKSLRVGNSGNSYDRRDRRDRPVRRSDR